MKRIIAAGAVALAALLIPTTTALADGPSHSHILPKGSPDAVYTTGHVGSAVGFGRYRVSQHSEDWNMDNYANPWGAGSFYWSPSGKQTNDYLKVTTSGATLVNNRAGTIFAPVKYGSYSMLALLGSNGPSRSVLTDVNGKLMIAPEGAHGPTNAQLWSIR